MAESSEQFRHVYTPAELNREVRLHLEAGFPALWLQGEISNLARPGSGHVYFSLKDERAQIRCALFKSRAARLGFRPNDGELVLARGRISLYEPRGDYQLIVEHLEPAGEGELRRQFEALKKKLAAEGLFEESRKRTLPEYPERIAVITSPQGAAVRDFMDVLDRRWPLARIRVYPSSVQGDQAPAELRRALAAAIRDGFGELLVVTRGGGSLEDLWAFNDETLVRELAECPVPVVSAVGHEVDFTLVDFIADLRAPTPSAAAELIAPDRAQVARHIRTLGDRLRRGQRHTLQNLAQRLDYARRRLLPQNPILGLREQRARLAELAKRLVRQGRGVTREPRERLRDLRRRLYLRHPRQALGEHRGRLTELRGRLAREAERRLRRERDRLGAVARALNAVSPLAVLGRGYAVVMDETRENTLTRREQFDQGQSLAVQFAEFRVDSRVEQVVEEPPLSDAEDTD